MKVKLELKFSVNPGKLVPNVTFSLNLIIGNVALRTASHCRENPNQRRFYMYVYKLLFYRLIFPSDFSST